MQHQAKSLRSFLGAANFELSRAFYREIGFKESTISPKMSRFKIGALSFYLQDYYVKDWCDNTMIFLEVEDVPYYWKNLQALELTKRYEKVKLTPIKYYDWGQECFLHDPAGNLWHFGAFLE
ncbi:MAG: glyoxalase [Saprospiraceae bacterium]